MFSLDCCCLPHVSEVFTKGRSVETLDLASKLTSVKVFRVLMQVILDVKLAIEDLLVVAVLAH